MRKAKEEAKTKIVGMTQSSRKRKQVNSDDNFQLRKCSVKLDRLQPDVSKAATAQHLPASAHGEKSDDLIVNEKRVQGAAKIITSTMEGLTVSAKSTEIKIENRNENEKTADAAERSAAIANSVAPNRFLATKKNTIVRGMESA